jgi:solute carrier family 45, member 1/2/4
LLFSIVAFAATLILPAVVGSGHHQSSRIMPRNFHTHQQDARLSTLLMIWSAGLAFSALLMVASWWTTNWRLATILVAANGVSWAISNWVPFALVGRLTAQDEESDGSDHTQAGLHASSAGRSNGAVSGVHNAAISAPQILAALICSGILSTAQRSGSSYGPGWVLLAGGFAYSCAGYLALRSARSKRFAFA